jgi:hypothetical protein
MVVPELRKTIKQAFHRVDGKMITLSVRSSAQSVQSPHLPSREWTQYGAGGRENLHAHR